MLVERTVMARCAGPGSGRIVGLGLLAGMFAAAPAGAQAVAPAAGPAPVIHCGSLANLRQVLRKSEGDPAAALPLIKDTRIDLGCGVLDPAAVTGIADHVSLNGQAYDCLALKHTGICHWVVAGSVKPPVAAPPATQAAPPPSAPAKPRR